MGCSPSQLVHHLLIPFAIWMILDRLVQRNLLIRIILLASDWIENSLFLLFFQRLFHVCKTLHHIFIICLFWCELGGPFGSSDNPGLPFLLKIFRFFFFISFLLFSSFGSGPIGGTYSSHFVELFAPCSFL